MLPTREGALVEQLPSRAHPTEPTRDGLTQIHSRIMHARSDMPSAAGRDDPWKCRAVTSEPGHTAGMTQPSRVAQTDIAAATLFERTRLAMYRAHLRLRAAEAELATEGPPEIVARASPLLDAAWSAAVEWTVWVVAIDDLVTNALGRERRDALVDEQERGGALTRVGGRLSGLRYLRNLHAHQLADTLHVLPRAGVARPSPRLAWVRFAELPLPDQANTNRHTPAQQEAYREHIAGMWVAPIAQRISLAFAARTWADALGGKVDD